MLSGASVALALSMLELGARGQTACQIAAVLGTSQLSPARQAAGWDALTSELAAEAASGHSLLDIADAIWQQRGLNVDGPFLDNLGKYFAGSLWQANFEADPVAASTAINAWVDKATGGRISQLFPPGVLDAMTRLVLVNAIHFKSAWRYPFSAGGNAPFHLATGGTASVSMMAWEGGPEKSVQVQQTAGATSVELPYASGSLAALIIEPSGPLARYLQSLSPTTLALLVQGLRPETGSLTMPSFQLRSQTNLSSLLAAMGMPLAFGPTADFANISPAPLYVSTVEHAAFLDVSEWGTEAAAATGIGMTFAAISGGFDITIDHPFLFLIRDTVTGAILFSSVVNNPTS